MATSKENEIELLKIWVSYTPEKREQQLAKMHKIIAKPMAGLDVKEFQRLTELLQDWHEELA